MNTLEKLKLYKEKQRLLKLEQEKEIDKLKEEDINEYLCVKNKNEAYKAISIMCKATVAAELIIGAYSLLQNDKFRYDISNFLKGGFNPIINDLCTQAYIYLLVSAVVFNILSTKFNELSDIYWQEKNSLETKNPNLKYIKE